jgi:hypothetical protein
VVSNLPCAHRQILPAIPPSRGTRPHKRQLILRRNMRQPRNDAARQDLSSERDLIPIPRIRIPPELLPAHERRRQTLVCQSLRAAPLIPKPTIADLSCRRRSRACGVQVRVARKVLDDFNERELFVACPTFRCYGSASRAVSSCGRTDQRGVMRSVKEKVKESSARDGASATPANAIGGKETLEARIKSARGKESEGEGSRSEVCDVRKRGIFAALTRVRAAHATSPGQGEVWEGAALALAIR